MRKKEWAAAHHTTYACGTSPRAANRRCKGDPREGCFSLACTRYQSLVSHKESLIGPETLQPINLSSSFAFVSCGRDE
jgi:hypothetical protein